MSTAFSESQSDSEEVLEELFDSQAEITLWKCDLFDSELLDESSENRSWDISSSNDSSHHQNFQHLCKDNCIIIKSKINDPGVANRWPTLGLTDNTV